MLRGEGHDVAVDGEAVELGAGDSSIVGYARTTDRVVLSEDADFRGADPSPNVEAHPGVLVCDTAAPPGAVAADVRRTDALCDDLRGSVLFVPGGRV